VNRSSSSARPDRSDSVVPESSITPDSNIYGGYWLVEWANSYPNTFVVRDLTVSCEPLPSSGEPEEWEWRLMAFVPGESEDIICGLDEPANGLEPKLVFEPDSGGRARTILVDSWGEGTVRLTSLGRNFFRAFLGYALNVSTLDQDRAAAKLNSFLSERELAHPDEIEFLLEATLGAFSETVWAGRVEMVSQGHMSNLIDLVGVRLDNAAYSHKPTSGDRWLNMIEFEGFREEAPLDSSRPRALHLRALPAFAALVNTPITISSQLLESFIAPERDSMYSPKEVPREMFIAALMVYALEEFGDDWEQGRSSDEALSLARWILGLDTSRRSQDRLEAMEILCTPIAGWTRALHASALRLARTATNISLREEEEDFSMLSSELEHTELDVVWASYREKLGGELGPILTTAGTSADITVTDDRSKLKLVFELHNDEMPTLTVTPSISATSRNFANDHHKAEYWLDWRPHGFLPNSSELELDHRVVQWDVVTAGIITFTARQSGLFDPTRVTFQVSARGVSSYEEDEYE
jgi:hypothetical protein